jgi:hypothetical protein
MTRNIDSLLDTVSTTAKFHYKIPLRNHKENSQGVEIEIETQDGYLFDFDQKLWKLDRDGSLRNYGYEFVLSNPSIEEELEKAFNSIEKTLEKIPLIDTIRTSTHIHQNVTDKTGLDVITIFGIYWIIEDLLLDYCGKYRKGNYNCISNSQSNGILNGFSKTLRTLSPNPKLKKNYSNKNSIFDYSNDNYRYSSLTPKPLLEFGSIEYRGMRSLVTKKELTEWSYIIRSIAEYQKKHKTIDIILKRFNQMTPKEIILDIFPKVYYQITAKGKEDWEDELIDNLNDVIGLKNSLFSWNSEELENYRKIAKEYSIKEKQLNHPIPQPVLEENWENPFLRGIPDQPPGQPIEAEQPFKWYPDHILTKEQKEELKEFIIINKINENKMKPYEISNNPSPFIYKKKMNKEKITIPLHPHWTFKFLFQQITVKEEKTGNYINQLLATKLLFFHQGIVFHEHNVRLTV